MPTLISIAVEHPEDYMRKIPLRTIAIDSDGRVWRGEAVSAAIGPTTIRWRPAISEFPDTPEVIEFSLLPQRHEKEEA